MDFYTKIDHAPSTDLAWNIPELKQGTVSVVGGNSQNFRTIIKISEFLDTTYPIQNLNIILPDSLQSKLPDLPNLKFLSSTDSGSFADASELQNAFATADFNLLIGDFSKNNITGQAITAACQSSEKPLLLTRDTVDLVAEHSPSRLLMNQDLILFASMPSLQKLLRSVYYPKMLLLSQSLVQVADTIHKFTLSYPVSVITLHNDQILIGQNGNVRGVPLSKSGYLPVTFWGGELAAKILALNLYNPHNFLDATISAIFH